MCGIAGIYNIKTKEPVKAPVVEKTGYFDFPSVEKLLEKCSPEGGKNISARDDMTLIGIVSLRLHHHQYIDK